LKGYISAISSFIAVFVLNIFWYKWFPEVSPEQSRWAAVTPDETGWFKLYLETGGYWLSYSYALSAAFAAYASMRFISAKKEAKGSGLEGGLAAGSITFAGALAIGGCFLVGCCGSPMLAVWLSLFGAAFFPFAKPLVAAVTTVTILAAWFWMKRRSGACNKGCREGV